MRILILSFLVLTGVFQMSNTVPVSVGSENQFVINVTDADFNQKIAKGLVIVDFWAAWCGPCRKQAPILDELATEMNGQVIVAKLDVDRNKQTSARYAVRSIPTLIIFKDGKAVERLVGLRDKASLKAILKKHQ